MRRMRLKPSNIGRAVRAGLGRDCGFTLIELMIAMAVVSIVMAAVAGVFTVLSRNYTAQNVAAAVQQDVRNGVERMAKDIRMAGLNPLKTADAGFGAVSADSIEIRADRNINGVIDAADKEHITYFFSDNRLIRRFNADAATDHTLARDVTDLRFTYLDDLDAATSDPLEIRAVEISMTVRKPAGRSQPVERSYAMRVRCRNLDL